MEHCIEIDKVKQYIRKLINDRKKINQEPTGDDLYAVLGFLVEYEDSLE